CLPPFAVTNELAQGKLVSLLDDHLTGTGAFRVLWPTSRYLAPKIRVFVDFMATKLFADQPSAQ
ncbi:MAG: LysR family transcriptional regulator, partial [Brucellaceae bacterium]|nr:LysR family transcriptional regulator [Brucellaceae bacterium]